MTICSSVQSLSRIQLFVTPQTAACQASLSITNSQSLLKLTSIELVMPSNDLILCRPLLLLPSISPSIKVFPVSQFFTSGGQSWSSSFGISPSSERSGLISFRMGWLQPSAKTCASLFVHPSLNHMYTASLRKGVPGFGSAYGPSESVARDFESTGL